MLTLKIGNSYSQLIGLTAEQHKGLKAILFYTIDPQASYFSGGFRSNKRYLIDTKGTFPTGLLTITEAWLIDKRVPYNTEDLRKRPKSTPGMFKLTLPHTPYPTQIDATVACLGRSRGTVSMCTGSGKSITAAMLIEKLQVKTLIIVPNLSLKTQLTASFLSYFGCLDNITIENIDSPALKKAGDYGLLICDESHHVAAKTYRDLNKKFWTGIYYRYFFTGTAFRRRDEEQLLMESISGSTIYSLNYPGAIKAGQILPIESYYIELPKRPVKAESWQGVYSELVVNNEERNKLLSELLLKFHANNISTLCLVKEIKHGENLQAMCNMQFAHGENEDTQTLIWAFNERKINCLIGTVGVIGEGVDSRPCEYVIIAGLGKARNQFLQNIGRAVRRYPGKESAKVIIIKDPSHKYSLNHFKEQVKLLRDYLGCEPTRLEF